MEVVRTIRKSADLAGKDPDHIVELCNEVLKKIRIPTIYLLFIYSMFVMIFGITTFRFSVLHCISRTMKSQDNPLSMNPEHSLSVHYIV